MTGPAAGTPADYFDQVWALGDDPWEHGSRWYETRKYDLTASALPRPRYDRSFEPGCGAGFLTRRLGARSARHLAMERHPRGVRATAERTRHLPGVTVVQGCIPFDWPDGSFDLIVLSEILYYLGDDALDEVLRRAFASLAAGGDLVAVHYRRRVEDHVRLGDEVHQHLRGAADWQPMLQVEDPDFVIDVVRR